MNNTDGQECVVVDLETTGLDPWSGTIIEVGICHINLITGEKRKLIDTLVKEPEFESCYEGTSLKNAWIFKYSSISIADLQDAPTWKDISPQIAKILAHYPCTAYNRIFDFSFLYDRGIEIYYPVPDPMITVSSILKLPGSSSKYKFPTLEEAWRGIFSDSALYKEQHRAYDDAFHTACLIFTLYQQGKWKPIIETSHRNLTS